VISQQTKVLIEIALRLAADRERRLNGWEPGHKVPYPKAPTVEDVLTTAKVEGVLE
jgi:hypothetical protein